MFIHDHDLLHSKGITNACQQMSRGLLLRQVGLIANAKLHFVYIQDCKSSY